ncbi:MAG: hypothetical protein KTR16_13415 [Acidiferrobacterales bacterium]|nr:hypothetical protein [Acidiferrobacterales bacterium]
MKWFFFLLLSVVVIYLNNAAWLRDSKGGELRLLAHRGVHQTYSKVDLSRDACTANRIHTPTHSYLENTISSIAKAFALGASMVEIDIHPTIDGHFIIFHDWKLDCRTNATGTTRKQTLSYLQRIGRL